MKSNIRPLLQLFLNLMNRFIFKFCLLLSLGHTFERFFFFVVVVVVVVVFFN